MPPEMTDSTLHLTVLVAGTFLAAGIVKGVTGMGLPTVAMGVLGALLSPLAAASQLIAPSLVTNVWQLLAGPSFGGVMRRLWPMMVAIALGTLFGSAILTGSQSGITTAALGATLVVYALYTLLARPLRVPERAELWLSPLIGTTTGVIAGATGVFVVPAVPYIQALGFEKDDLVQALGLSFTISTSALAASLAWRGALHVESLGTSALAIIPALAGMWVGRFARDRISSAAFKRGFLVVLMLLGLEMLSRAIV
jgi:uncharacterized membrane protein YfcA